MLDVFIIEEIKRRERTRREEQERPFVELPVPPPEDRPARRSDTDQGDPPQRGVVVIDL